MANKDGADKNNQQVLDELKELVNQWKLGLARFKDITLKFDSKNNVFHLTQNLITETYRALPRTLSYLTSGALIYVFVVKPYILPLVVSLF